MSGFSFFTFLQLTLFAKKCWADTECVMEYLAYTRCMTTIYLYLCSIQSYIYIYYRGCIVYLLLYFLHFSPLN